MSMIGGNVLVADDEAETETISGLAGAIYTSLKTSNAAYLAQVLQNFDDALARPQPQMSAEQLAKYRDDIRLQKKAASVGIKRYWAKQANELGPPIVAYIQAEARIPLANVVATVSTSTSTGRTPNPNDPNTAIQGPASAVELPVTGDAGAVELLVT